jgi:hypothetical protein
MNIFSVLRYVCYIDWAENKIILRTRRDIEARTVYKSVHVCERTKKLLFSTQTMRTLSRLLLLLP